MLAREAHAQPLALVAHLYLSVAVAALLSSAPCAAALALVGAREVARDPLLPRAAGGSSTASTSSSSTAAAAAAATTKTSSSSSYITLNLPDSFVQCTPAVVGFTSVVSESDEDFLGGSISKVLQNTWINVKIRDRSTGRLHITQDLKADAVSWTWPAVDLPAGTAFDILVASLTNVTFNASASSQPLTFTSRHRTFTRTAAVARREPTPSPRVFAARSARDPHRSTLQTVAQVIARSDVIAGPNNDTSCLGTATSSPAGTGRKGSGDEAPWAGHGGDPAASRSTDRTVIVVAAVLGGLCGLFIALVGALCWHKRKDQRRLRTLAEASGSGYSHDIAMARRSQIHTAENARPSGDATGAASAHARGRSSAVPLWDGGYRDGPSAGWGYMASLAPGLAPQAPPAFSSPTSSPIEGAFAAIRGRRRRNQNGAAPVNRRREDGDEDLPTYVLSEHEFKALPDYEAEGQDPFDAAQSSPPRSSRDRQTLQGRPFYYDEVDAQRGESHSLLEEVAAEEGDVRGGERDSGGSFESTSYVANQRGGFGGPSSFQAPAPAEVGRSMTMSTLSRGSRVSGGAGASADRSSDASGSVVFNGASSRHL
ncbi:unnamed protein product [Parajaminaea phylloscopi]